MLHETGAAVHAEQSASDDLMGDLWAAGRPFLAGFRRHFAYLLPAVFILPFEIYEFIIRPNAAGDLPDRLSVTATAFPWVLGATALWTAFLTYRDLYKEKLEIEAHLPQTDEKLLNELRAFYKGRSHAEGDRLVQPHIGRTVTVRGRVTNISVYETSATVWLNDQFNGEQLSFPEDHLLEVTRLRIGHAVTVEGKIRRVDQLRVELGNCRLIPSS